MSDEKEKYPHPSLAAPPAHKLTFKEAMEIIIAGGKVLIWVVGLVWALAVFKTKMDSLASRVKEQTREIRELQINVATMCGSIKNCKMVTRQKKVKDDDDDE